MKRKFTFLLMALLTLAGFRSWGQETLTVCDGTASSYQIPINGYWFDTQGTLSQFVIPSSKIENLENKSITQLQFYIFHMDSYGIIENAIVECSLAEVENETMTSGVTSGLTKVFEGHLSTASSSAPTTMTVPFDTPYNYGGGNLLVSIKVITLSGATNYGFYCESVNYNAAYCYDWQDNFYQILPKTTITYEAAVSCPAPTDLTASNITATGATISWTGNGAESYDLAYGVASTFDSSNPSTYTPRNGLTTTSVQLTGLIAETEYKCAVKAHCSEEEESAWSAVYSFTPSATQHLTVNDGTTTNQYVPIYGYYCDADNQHNQFIIPAEQLADINGGTISDMTFYLSSLASGAWGRTWTVKLMETTETTISSLINVSSATSVYTGVLNGQSSTMEVPFSTPYAYNGGNLLVDFSYSGGSGSWKSANFYGISTTYYSSYYNYNSTFGGPQQFLPKTTFTYIPGATRYDVICDNSIEHGTISANPSNAAAGTVIELTATPENGYGLSAWTVTNVTTSETITVTNNQFTMPESDVNVTATFVVAQKYTITCNNPAVGGTIHAEYGGVTINEASEGITITLVAVPSTGCSLNYFTVDGAQIVGNTFTMPDHNVTVSAVFALEPQNLTVNDGTETLSDIPFNTYYSDGSYTKSQFIIPSNDLVNMFDGTITNLTFFNSYSSYFAFTGTWNVYMKEVDYTTIQNSDYFPTSEEDLVYAGTLSLNSGMLEIALTHPYTYSDGNLMLCFEQTSLGNATNYSTYWYGVTAQSDVCRTGYDYSYGGGYHYNYNFLPKTTFRYMPSANPPARYTITVNQTEGGNISASKTSVTEGTLISLTATPDYGYEFVEWNITPNVEITNNQFTMPGSNVTVSATFTTKQGHTVTITNPTDNAHTTAVLTATPNTEVIADDEVRLSYSDLAEGYKFVNYVATNASTFEPIAIQEKWDDMLWQYYYCFTMPNADVNLTANVKLIRTINVAEMQHGNLDLYPNNQITAGETITITPYPDYGYAMGTLTITEATSGNTITPEEQTTTYTFVMPEDNVNISATFVATGTLYTVTLPEETEIGRVSAYPADEGESSTEYFENDQVCIYGYVYNSNYYLKSVVVKKNSDQTVVDFYQQEGNNYYFIMPADNVTVTATFEEKPRYTVNVPAFTGGTVTASETSVMANTMVYLDYAANDGYTFAGITIKKDSDMSEVYCYDGSWYGHSYYFYMPEGNVTVNAEFKQICNLTVCDGYSLNMHVPIYGYYVDMQSYLETQFILPKDILEEMIGGSINSLTFYANYSKDFVNASWDIFMQETNSSTLSDIVSYSGTPVYSGHLAIVSNQLVITLDNAYTYGGNNLLITFHKTSTGSCSTSNNDKFYGISATNGSSGYKNGNFYTQSFLPKTTFSYTPAVKYNINYDNGITGGNITASPNPAAAGTTVTLSATPAFGYEFGAWVENDEDVTIENNQFIMPGHDVTISATFNELTQYAITCATLDEGAIHAEYNGVTINEAPEGTEITLVAVPNTGYILDQFVVNGASIVGNTYTMPDSEITISATFIPALTVYDNGGDAAEQRWPFYANYGNQFTKSNMIMPAADLTDMAGGTINSMKFYVKSFSTDPLSQCSSTWQVYLKEVSENETTGPVDVTTATKVFEGVIDFKVSEITINFTEPFEYDGGNLLIATQNIDKTGWNPVYFYGEVNSYGYVCSGVKNINSSLDDITSWMVTSKFLPKTTFFYTPGETRYNITLNQTEGGTISADMDKASAGTEVTLSHEADVFHTFGAWVEEYDDVTIVNDKFTMPDHNVTISATFNELTQYTINITPNDAATIHATYNDETISKAPEGLVIDLSYDNLQSGYTFDHWRVVYNGKVDVEVIDNQFTMPEYDVTVSAVFNELTAHTVTIATVEGGTISVSANEEPISTGEDVYPGTMLTFGNTPAKNSYGYDRFKFNHYVVTEEGQQAQDLGTGINTYTMPNCNLTVSAVFDPLYFPTLSSNYPNYVTLWAGPDNAHLRSVGGPYLNGVAEGEYVFINAEDIEGYRKTITWSDSEGPHETITYPKDNRPCFIMPADNNVTVSVTYTQIQKYNVALVYNTDGGNITVSETSQVEEDAWVYIYINSTYTHYTFTADSLRVTCNTTPTQTVEITTVTEGYCYNFQMPADNVTVHAKFTEDENYSVTVNVPTGCTFDVTYQPGGQNPTTETVYVGCNVYLNNFELSPGYRFDGWNVTYKDSEENDQPVDVTELPWQTYFVMPQGPVTITADVHELIAHTITVVQTTGGDITVNGNNESFQALEGSTITMSYSNLLEGYIFDRWIITTSTNTYQTTNSSFSMLGEDLSVKAQFLKESIVNDGSSTNNNIPINCYFATYYNTRSQFIINSNDLQDMYDASITDMTFFIQSTSSYSYTATWDVYLKEVDETEFASDAYVDVTEMTKVYTGTMTIADYKMKIHFDAPFTYTDKNLMVSFVQTTNSGENDPYISDAWYGVYTQNSHVAYGTSGWETSSSTNFLPKTKFSYKPSETPTTRYAITVNEVEGTTITASREVAAAGTVITLTQETSSEYDFNSWDVTTATGSVTVDENNQFTMPAANVTVSANVTPKPHYFVTLDEEMTNGTLTLSPGSEIGYMEGVTVSISTNPETGYKFDEDYGVKAWKAGDPTTVVEVTTGYSGYNITMPEYNIVISARFIALTGYTITYHVNGVETPETVYENERIQPSTPATPAGTSFVGWATSDIATYSETEPTLFETGDYPISDVELYAVFRYTDQSKWAPVYDESSLSTTGSDRVIFAYYDSYSGGDPRIMTYYDSWHFESATGEMNSTSEIVSIPANTTIFRPEKTNDTWKFYFDYNGSETTLADYGGNNLYPLSYYSDGTETDTWNISLGFVYDNNDYIGLRNDNTFNIFDSNQARLYKEVKPEVTLDAYFTEVLSISGNEILNGNMTTRNLLINRGANCTVNDNITLTVTGFAKNVENIAANFVFKNGAEFHYNNNDGTVSATFEKNIVGYNDPDAIGDGWYFIANPTDNTTVNLSGGYSYDLYTFNPAAAAEWHNEQYDNNVQIPENGIAISRETGYLYANSNNHTLRFEGGLLTSETEKVINLVYAEEGGSGIDFPGFNLIGNPFPCTAYSDFDIYKLFNGSEVLISEDGTVDPCEAFFVEAKEVGETVTLSTTAPGKSYAMPIVVNSNRGETLDRAILHLEGTRDSHKFMMNPDRTNISFTKNGEKFAAVSRGDETEIPMNFTADHKGSYTISVNTENFEEEYLHLIDVVSGDDIDLLVTPSYTFEADADEYASRFRIVFGTTGINDDPATSSAPFVYISNGNLVINNIEGTASMQIIDMLGRIVRTETVCGSYNKPHNLKAGAYVITLDGRAQRIVIE